MTKLRKEGIGSRGLEIEPDDLKKRLDAGEDIYILDVRTPEEYQAWRISYDRYQNPPLIPVDQLFSLQNKAPEQIPKDKEIVTVCAHGNRSMMAAKLLSRQGYDVKSVRGGMSGWNAVYDIAEIHTQSDAVRIWQVRRVSKGCIGYLVASRYDSNAMAIDPTCEIDGSYIKLARENNLRITKVADTHMHADHVSGASRLARSVSASLHISQLEGYEVNSNNDREDAGRVNNIKWIKSGEKIQVGRGVELVAVHTPGHTDGSMSFSMTDGSTGGRKYLFTGDTLFVDGVGRPDLKEDAKGLASKLYGTYHGIFSKSKYPDDNTVILPGHFNVNATPLMHGKAVSDTLGAIRQRIIGSLPNDKKGFVNVLLHNTPPKPANYMKIVELNKGLAPCDKMQIAELETGPNSCGISATKGPM